MSKQANGAIERPTTYHEVLQSGEALHWKAAIESESKSLNETTTWKVEYGK